MTAIRPATLGDLDRLVALNNEAVPAVSPADLEHMERLLNWASLAWVVDDPASADDDGPVAFVLLFEPGSDYPSPNYAWFAQTYEQFLYIDRVVVAPSHRGVGLGGRLYEAVAGEAARRGSVRVTAEVNLEPPNPGSSRFHRRHGFEAVGALRLGDEYEVEMLARPVG